MAAKAPVAPLKNDFQLSAYDYHLPEENIAQHPVDRRDQSRLLVLDCPADTIAHRRFADITELFMPGDLLVANNTRVFPARLFGVKESGGKVEILLLHYPEARAASGKSDFQNTAEALVLLKSSKRPRPGSRLLFGEDLQATVLELFPDGKVRLALHFSLPTGQHLADLLARLGQMPLPPYIKRPAGTTGEDFERYQTRFAIHTGSVAAPTAGLHFSDELLATIRERGVTQATVTLHVGYGTFAPVRCDNIHEHRIHAEFAEVPLETAEAVNRTRREGGRIWAVGTTTTRTLEFCADEQGRLKPFQGACDLFIVPGYRFRVVDNLITNFHLPQSSLLFLVSALAGRERILAAYARAVEMGYRFYSYGDAMAILTRPR
ncbi:MAG: tRNA preQ1(34) S-adenosylmethionine ribosyltransferase-isomerase QueA [Thermodesulfobacteriota bacterium]